MKDAAWCRVLGVHAPMWIVHVLWRILPVDLPSVDEHLPSTNTSTHQGPAFSQRRYVWTSQLMCPAGFVWTLITPLELANSTRPQDGGAPMMLLIIPDPPPPRALSGGPLSSRSSSLARILPQHASGRSLVGIEPVRPCGLPALPGLPMRSVPPLRPGCVFGWFELSIVRHSYHAGAQQRLWQARRHGVRRGRRALRRPSGTLLRGSCRPAPHSHLDGGPNEQDCACPNGPRAIIRPVQEGAIGHAIFW